MYINPKSRFRFHLVKTLSKFLILKNYIFYSKLGIIFSIYDFQKIKVIPDIFEFTWKHPANRVRELITKSGSFVGKFVAIGPIVPLFV